MTRETYDPYSGKDLDREELIDKLVGLVDQYFEETQRLKRELAVEKERTEHLRERLTWARDYNDFSAKACPLCTYRGGYFIKRCSMHAEIDGLREKLKEKGECS